MMMDPAPRSRPARRTGIAWVQLALLAILISSHPKQPVVVWNASASVPIGLYRLHAGQPRRGDIVAIKLPPNVAAVAARRGYLPSGVLLLKPVAATVGDHICRRGRLIAINGAVRAVALTTDGAVRPLPTWNGCRTLQSGEVAVLGPQRSSFDSRYFGPISTNAIVGRAIPIWVRQP